MPKAWFCSENIWIKKDVSTINLKERENRNAKHFNQYAIQSPAKNRIRQSLTPNSRSIFKIVNEVSRKGHFLKRTIIYRQCAIATSTSANKWQLANHTASHGNSIQNHRPNPHAIFGAEHEASQFVASARRRRSSKEKKKSNLKQAYRCERSREWMIRVWSALSSVVHALVMCH